MPEGKQIADKRVQQVKESVDSDLLSNAESEDIDTETIIKNQIAQNEKYGDSTIARFAETAIRREVEAANAETIEGIILGSRDRHGANWPRRHSIIRSSGEHMEVSTWDGSLPAGDGTEMEIPSGVIVSMDVDYDEEYDSYEGRRINNVRDIGIEKLVENLGKVAMEPSDLTAGDEYETRAVRGRIQFINPRTMFEDGEPAGDGEIMAEDDRGQLRPHFEVVLEGDGETRFRAHAERQSYGRPYFNVPDLEALCIDAYERYDEPDRQAQFVGDGLKGVEVIVVGNISGYNRDRDGDGNPVTYVDMGMTGIVAVDADDDDQPGLDDFDGEDVEEDDVDADESAEGPTPDAGGSDEESEDGDDEGPEDPGDFEDYEPDEESENSENGAEGDSESFECENCGDTFASQPALNGHKGSCEGPDEVQEAAQSENVEVVRESIENYCDLTGEAFEDMTVEDVNENLRGVEADDAVVRAALNPGDGDGESEDADAESDSGGDDDSEEESDGDVAERLLEENGLKAGGTFACPVDDCLASAGSASGVLGHAKADHDTDGYESPLDWLKDTLDA